MSLSVNEMRSHLTTRFRRLLLALPPDIRRQAYRAYAQFKRDPSHPGLNFKLVNQREQMWSARINDYYRVLGIRDGGEITWFWVGEHREYERIIRKGP
jgi:hypothetical protein